MEKKINNILFFTGKDGTQMVFKVLFTYYSESFKKDYCNEKTSEIYERVPKGMCSRSPVQAF